MDKAAGTYTFNFNKTMLSLFCLYAFSIPFELVLEIFFDIDTIFKPFRVISLLIIGTFVWQVVQNGLKLRRDVWEDFFLYAVFIYGVLVSFIRMITGVFHMGLFINDIFQSTLYLVTFFIFKTLPFSSKDLLKILGFFVAGVFVNALNIFYNFIIKGDYSRGTGFSDNPNYVALGLVAAMAFLLLRLPNNKGIWLKIRNIAIILIMVYTFITAGSRTGLILFLLVNLFVFIFSSLRAKVVLLFTSIVLASLLLTQQMDKKTNLGGSPLILFERLNAKQTKTDEDTDPRFRVWQGIFRALETEGYLGMGIGQYKAKFSKYFQDEPNKIILEMVNRNYYLSTHNDYLAILTDYGLPGLLFYLIFLLLSFKKNLKNLLSPTEEAGASFLVRYNFMLFICLIIFGMAAESFQHQLYWFLLMFITKSITNHALSNNQKINSAF